MIKKIITLTLTITCSVVNAVPYEPKDPEFIIAKLPVSIANQIEINKSLEQQNEEKNITKKVRQLIALAKQTSDPRYYGYAEALIRKEIKAEQMNAELLLYWAEIQQHHHQYDAALLTLKRVLSTIINPKDNYLKPQTWLMRSVIYQNQGQYDLALKDCYKLLASADTLIASTCLFHNRSFMGQLNENYQSLKVMLKRENNVKDNNFRWAMLALAEMARRLNLQEDSENYYREILKIDSTDTLVLSLYADSLLHQERYHEVIDLLSAHKTNDKLLLRLAIAKKNINYHDVNEDIKILTNRYNLLKTRNDKPHLREQVLFQSELLDDKKSALVLAQLNWDEQKEIEDLRLLLKQILVTKQFDKLQQLSLWLSQNPINDFESNTIIKTINHLKG